MAQKRRTRKSAKRRQPRARRGPATPAAEREVSAFARRVKSKERSLSRLQATVQRRVRAQHDAEARKRELESERDVMRATLDVLTSQRRAAADERRVAARELKQAAATWNAIQKRARTHPQYRAIKAAVASVDRALDRRRAEVSTLEKQVTEAEAATSVATAALTVAEQERRDAQAALQQIPNDIRAARRHVSKLISDLQSVAADNPERVVAAEREVGTALDALRRQTRQVNDTHLVHSLVDTRATDEARARLEAQSQQLAKLKADLATAQAAVAALLQRRNEDVQSRIRAVRR
jgi:chromosome segregation ATPase